MFTAIASPPSDVSLYFEFMSFAVSHMVLITLSKGTLAFLESVSKANYAALIAFIAPMVFLSIHGI